MPDNVNRRLARRAEELRLMFADRDQRRCSFAQGDLAPDIPILPRLAKRPALEGETYRVAARKDRFGIIDQLRSDEKIGHLPRGLPEKLHVVWATNEGSVIIANPLAQERFEAINAMIGYDLDIPG